MTENNRLKQRAAVKDREWSHSLKEDGRARWYGVIDSREMRRPAHDDDGS